MKTMSIKSFAFILLFITLLSSSYFFYAFYSHTKNSIAELVTANIQTQTLNLKHYLNKNITQISVNNIRSSLDSTTQSSAIISDIHILDAKNKILYSSDTSYHHHAKECRHISQIEKEAIFTTRCYSFSIKLYKGLQPFYYNAKLFIDKKYLDSLLFEYTKKYTLFYILFAITLTLLLWLILKKSLITPLKMLQQYAYYSDKKPAIFFIKEIESIRYSLWMTFSRLKKEQNELYQLSTKDPLSGLYNRLSLVEKIQWLIKDKERSKNKFAIIFLDLDNFKNINDSMGHDFGDTVLQHIAQILLDITRENDIVSRIGGDEFVIVLPNLKEETRIFELADRIIERLSIPVKTKEYKYQITASMGVVTYPRDGNDVQTLLKNADIAMYKSKELGKNNYHFFTNALNLIVQEKIHMQHLINNALENKHFRLYYQAKVDTKTSVITGCEALIRLIDPIEGLIPPDKFISIAEENNSIIPIGAWVIQEAIQQIKNWENTAMSNLKVSINVSAQQFLDMNLIKLLTKEVQKIDVTKLDIELTESVFASDFQNKLEIIEKIKALGISLSLDDFGTGYSSLSYLKNIPFDTIKIDKSFIDDFIENENDKSFVDMIIKIAKTLHLHVVAEGVEKEEQRQYLQEIECETFQGYLCSKPLCVEDFQKLILSNKNC